MAPQTTPSSHDPVPRKRRGRPEVAVWTKTDVLAIRELYLRTNRGVDLGSMSHAVRRALWEDAHATAPGLRKLSEEARAALSRPMHSKHYIPRSLRRQLAIAPQVVRHHRSPRDAALSGPYVPGFVRLTLDGSRRLYAGERFVADDASQNQIVCVPWTWGGSKEADRHGIRTARGQWLVVSDCATDMIVAWVFTLRPRDSYRAADTLGLLFRACRDVALPAEAVMEGGAWQSRRMLEFFSAAGIRVLDAKGRPHLKLVEGIFNKVWTHLSVYERGQIGRYRGEYERENKLLARCRSGAENGRKHFPMLPELLRELNEAVRFHNADRIESKVYGSWTPHERWAEDLAERPRGKLDEALAPLAAPECRQLTVRRGGLVEARVASPLGIQSLYVFAHEELAAFERARVNVCFDPFESAPRAAIVLRGGSNLGKPGDLICSAPCLSPPPLPVARLDFELGLSTPMEGAALKKAMASAVRTEYCALGEGGRAGARLSELRGPDGVERVERTAAEPSPAPSAERAPRNFGKRCEAPAGRAQERALPRVRTAMELAGID